MSEERDKMELFESRAKDVVIAISPLERRILDAATRCEDREGVRVSLTCQDAWHVLSIIQFVDAWFNNPGSPMDIVGVIHSLSARVAELEAELSGIIAAHKLSPFNPFAGLDAKIEAAEAKLTANPAAEAEKEQ